MSNDAWFYVIVLAIIFRGDINLLVRALVKRWSK